MSTPETPKQIIDSNSGWRMFAKVLTEQSPSALAQADKARSGIRRLVRTGR